MISHEYQEEIRPLWEPCIATYTVYVAEMYWQMDQEK